MRLVSIMQLTAGLLPLWAMAQDQQVPKLPVTTDFVRTIEKVEAKPVNADVDGQAAAVRAEVTLDQPIRNCGADILFAVKEQAVVEHLHALNVRDRQLRQLGEEISKLVFSWVPDIRGYTADDLKGVKFLVRSYMYTAQVLQVEALKPAHSKKGKPRQESFRVTFNRSFPLTQGQALVKVDGKTVFVHLTSPLSSGSFSAQKLATFDPAQRALGTPDGQVYDEAGLNELVGRKAVICSYSSGWSSGGSDASFVSP